LLRPALRPRSQEGPATLKYAVAWLVLMMLFAALTGGLNWLTYWKLAHRGVSVQGTVIQVLPEVHATVRHRYYVDGREYRGQTQPRQPNPPIERLAEGATLMVWYDPRGAKNVRPRRAKRSA
jgi:hypothetical protein